ncbi:hypothetical protein CF319_g2204 [Tilletia indica]|nr:hypothetical protein CF319_g2204 [Tilletia indica]
MRSSVSMDSPPYNGSDRTYDGSYYRSVSESEDEDAPQDDPRPDVWENVDFPQDDPPPHDMSYLGAIFHIRRRVNFRERDFMTRNPRLPLNQRWSMFFQYAHEALSFQEAQVRLPYRYYSTMVQYVLNLGQYMVPWAHRRAQRTPDILVERAKAKEQRKQERIQDAQRTPDILEERARAKEQRKQECIQEALSTEAPVGQEPEDTPLPPLPSRIDNNLAGAPMTQYREEALVTTVPFLRQLAAEVEETGASLGDPDATRARSAAGSSTTSPPSLRRDPVTESPTSKRRRLFQTTLLQRQKESAARKAAREAARNWRASSSSNENASSSKPGGSSSSSSGFKTSPLSSSSAVNTSAANHNNDTASDERA